jgi:hypothetical protein
MNTLFAFSLWAWLVVVAVVLVLALYRMALTRGNYTVLHVRRSELSLIPEQIMRDRRLDRTDFWGQLLTAVAFVLGVALLAMYVYVGLHELGG